MDKEVELLLGGSDKKEDYLSDSTQYCDKLDHFSRSVAHQPNHIRVLEKIVGPIVIGENQIPGVPIETHRENKRRMKKF